MKIISQSTAFCSHTPIVSAKLINETSPCKLAVPQKAYPIPHTPKPFQKVRYQNLQTLEKFLKIQAETPSPLQKTAKLLLEQWKPILGVDNVSN